MTQKLATRYQTILRELDHLRTVANFPDESGKYFVKTIQKQKNALRIAVWAMIRETNL